MWDDDIDNEEYERMTYDYDPISSDSYFINKRYPKEKNDDSSDSYSNSYQDEYRD